MDLNKPGSLAGLFGEQNVTSSSASSEAGDTMLQKVEDLVIDKITKEFSSSILQDPKPDERARISERVSALVSQTVRASSLNIGYAQETAIATELAARLMGLGFLDQLLPPARTDLSEITIYSHGLVQVMKKGSVRFETIDLHPSPKDVERVLTKLFGPQNKRFDESNPTVNAKLPATEHNPGGGRIKALHPVIVPPGVMPSVNIRLFEQKPVLPQWLLDRGAMSPEMMDDLRKAIQEYSSRIMITGGTRTGKTTMLSALCNFLPEGWRVVKIEDPSEIWIDRDTVQTIEARPSALGTEVKSYTLANAVDDAMRMSPDYLIVGEVRDGAAALALFRAMLTGHSGACTFHADSPREMVRRLVTVMGADAQVRAHEASQTIADAIDLVIQINIRNEKRVVSSIQNISRQLKNGDVFFQPVWKINPDGKSWTKVGEIVDRTKQAQRDNDSDVEEETV